ncbi:proteobacterial dedicated sortase system histidine kinase [Psychromonas sp. Urea-02u-13]|uniref:proteobacterial dedicated sortase system histidine kinase n=1 Tax=Psychromonas sp. Urea-02u-13 TaxID=2058326 RepID=UPI000C34BA30|nr:proteobacterial dedicated sortase system histidine kinase [Psychromonas sp. Urea-02u-13]PKG40056.1 proteobacterial dedicated sortase system histidine kinase [Psychromonas sp. Urea-02u-13]
MMAFLLGLRGKVILLASFFLILPWLGYQYILEMENFLRQGQEQTLIGTTRAVATALHERPKLFNAQASSLNKIEDGKDLYAYDIKFPLRIDGQLEDWKNQFGKSLVYAQKQTIFQQNKNSKNPISFRHMLGTQGKYLYGYLQVTDKNPVYRPENSRFLNRNDHLIIAFSSSKNKLQRYIISVEKPGWFNAYKLTDESKPERKEEQGFWQDSKDFIAYLPNLLVGETDKPPQREKRIQGYWKKTKQGYNIEFRFPISLLGDKFGLALHTTSNKKTGEIGNIIATSNTKDLQKLGTVLVPSPEIDKILKGLSHTQSRLWVVDRHQRVLASAGDIHQASGVWATNNQKVALSPWEIRKQKILAPLYNLLLSKPNDDFVDELKGSTQLNSEFIKHALSGQSQSSWRLTSDNKAMILSAASPIFIGDKVMGIVVAEETTNGIRSLRNQALEKLFNVLIAVIIVGTLLLFFFTANIASRVAKLRKQAEDAIDEQGRIAMPFTPSTSNDEIGYLSRSLSDMVNRLGEYHRYLENLPSRLSHELGTPVAVVRSSLENLALLPQTDENQKYISRSQTGILRLNRILTSMSEATRLEQSLQCGEKISLSLHELLTGCLQGYQMTYAEHAFLLTCSDNELNISADPDFMVQCLDKLINNAMEFNLSNEPITISLKREDNLAIICVENKGPLLPNDMSDELLNSMVSVRDHNNPEKTHLGLGLFIAKMICDFHHATISINNNEDINGVNVTLRFPLI